MPAIPYRRWRPHPWHGLEVGPEPPQLVTAYIEITPFDPMKYEIDKATGYLKIDRPQRTSSYPPALYGFIPRTYCGAHVCALSEGSKRGDGDPLDICVISERPVDHSEIILTARILGGIRTIDGEEADDKIIAVLEKDTFWGGAHDLDELPQALIDRLRHYFSTYKMLPGQPNQVRLYETYKQDHAFQVVEASMQDYLEEYGEMDSREGI